MSSPDRASPLAAVPWWVIALGFAAIAVFFLWEEHHAHILGALPWIFFAACPLMHLVMHRGHHHHHHDRSERRHDG